MSRIKDEELIGVKFGKLTVIKRSHKSSGKDSRWLWECLCDCGKTSYVRSNNLKSGNSKSCSCFNIKMVKKKKETHGLSNTKIYDSYRNMIDRCLNPKNKKYYNYGGRGITVCDRWLGHNGLINFNKDMKDSYEKGLQLDRIDPNGDYTLENCRWVTNQQNSMNTRSHRDSVSKYKGVSPLPKGKWLSRLVFDGNVVHDQRFNSEVEAAEAYNEAAIKYFGKHAY